MHKKHLTKQQAIRIKKKQRNYQEKNVLACDAFKTGLVIVRFSRHALIESIESNEKQRIHCSIRPEVPTLVAGDKVVWQPLGQKQGIIISCYPRETVLERPSSQGASKPIAANISQILIVIAPLPIVSWSLLDSYLVMATHLKLHASIILNKIDLPFQSIKERLFNEYYPLGYPLFFTNTKDKDSLRCLEETLTCQTSIMVGQSGVGKSSLIECLLPQSLPLQTTSLSSHRALGQHTTSYSCLYHLTSGGYLIDSPGIREFGLWKMAIPDIAGGFEEFRPYLSYCKYRDCNHIDTPGCALKTAVEQQRIGQHRYENYVKLCMKFSNYPHRK